MTDKEIAKRIKELLPTWQLFKNTDSISELHEISNVMFSTLAQILEELNNDKRRINQ